MKRDKLYTFLTSAVLAFGLSVSSVMCLTTGFDLTVDSLTRLMGLCGITALVYSLVFQLKRGGLLFWGLSAILAGYAWHLAFPFQQLLALIQHICEVYNNAYHWGVPALAVLPQSADYPLMLLGYLAAAAISFWGTRGSGLFSALVLVLTPLFLCLVVTDTVPDTQYLFLILAGCGTLILTSSVRRQNIQQGNRLAVRTAVPIAAMLALLFLLSPQENYTNHSESLRNRLIAWAQTLPQQVEARVTALSTSMELDIVSTVDLSALSGQNLSSAQVMTVTAQSTGTLYLRGQDYDRYTGTGWISDAERAEIFTRSHIRSSDVTIRTRRVQDILYIPYYPSEEFSLAGGYVPNPENLQEYLLPTGNLTESSEEVGAGKYGILPEAARYLQLPESTLAAASQLLSAILPESGSHSRLAAAIGAYVRSSALYDLNPEQMPREEEDFVLWFLTDADRGYCVHFATASVVLLRAAGIPARYVTGYMTTTQAGIPTTVTEKSAHAWAEYYEPRLDAWLILESTPADSSNTPVSTADEPESPAPTEHTVPPFTQAEEMTAAAGPAPSQIPETQELDWEGILQTTLYLAIAGSLLLTAALQRRIRLALRRRRQTQGAVNTQALERWREAEALSRLLKQTPTEELLTLAQKAKFSQHDLCETELQQFDGYIRTCRQQLQRKPWYIRLLHQYIFAAY